MVLTCDFVMTSKVHYYNQVQANGTYHFKILVPSIAAGAIIGKGGEAIAQLQKEAGSRVKMSKADDFYPGTTERVCLITGSVEGILRTHEYIMEKIKEKPDPNAQMGIHFDHKQPVEREKQVKILVPNSTAGMIIGKSGSYIKQIKEESGAYIQISQKSKDHALAERCITVMGEIENNKTACHMILAKIVEDPQSGSCLNISYADVTGPVANFNPTGSPFANPGSVPSGAMNISNPNYISSGSLNSRSLTPTDNFHNPQIGATHSGVMPFTGEGMNGSAVLPSNTAQIIETIKVMLRDNGYSEQAVTEISAAMNTLADYGMLGLGMLSGAQIVSGLGIGMPSSEPTSGSVPPGKMTNQGMYTSATDRPGMETTCNFVATSGPIGTESSMSGLLGNLDNKVSGSGLGLSFTSPTTSRSNDSFPVQAEAAVFEPFRRASSALASPNAGDISMNNNSFGLETGSSPDSSSLRKSPTPSNRQISDAIKIDVEIGENIVGAILGPGGKSLVEIQRFSGANIQISKKGIFAPGTRNRIVTITGLANAVNTAQYLIERQVAQEEAKRAQQNNTGVLR